MNKEDFSRYEGINNSEETHADSENTTFDKKKFIKNIIVVLISNCFSIISGILIGFIIPKLLGVTEYGYYKTFTLYSSYIGVLHFGFIDGIYLKYAGKSYNDLNKEKFRTYTIFLFVLEFIITLILIVISFLFYSTNYFLIILFVGINVLATNVTTYFEFISQITMKFNRITLRNVIKCTLNIISVIILYILYKFNNVTIYNYVYVLIILIIQFSLALWYLISYREIVFGKRNSFFSEMQNIKSFFKVGLPLMLTNIISQLIFVVDQQFVNVAFDMETYSVYAFAYNMISIITIAIGAISTVLYPTLRTINTTSIATNYSKINSYLLIFVSLCLVSYYPLCLIVNSFLPKYSGSLPTFLIILPGILISSSISVIKYNCYKTFGKINNYFIKSAIILIIAILADIVVYFIFRNVQSISIVSILVLLLWYVLVEIYFVRAFKVKWINNFVYMILIICFFYGVSFIPNVYISLISYICAYILVTLLFYHAELGDLINKFFHKCNSRGIK